MVLATIVAACLALVWPRFADADESESRWRVKAEVESGYTDNVRWAEDGSKKDDAYFTTLLGRVGWQSQWPQYLPSRLAFKTRARFYSTFSQRDWVEIEPQAFYKQSLVAVNVGHGNIFKIKRVDNQLLEL